MRCWLMREALNKSVSQANGIKHEAAHDCAAGNMNVPVGVVGRTPRNDPGEFKRDESSKQEENGVSCTRTGWMSARYARA